MNEHTTSLRVSLGDQITAQVINAADNATDAEKQRVDELIDKAAKHALGNQVVEMVEYTPGMAAIIVRDHNNFNRFWTPEWTSELARMMIEGDWRPSGQTYAFYHQDSDLADGGHRLRAQIVASTSLVVPTFFSMEKADAAVIDCGKRRSAADAAALSGLVNASEKEALLKAIWTYERAAKIPIPVSDKNPRAVAREMQKHDAVLERAIELGATSLVDIIDPLLKDREAAKIVGIFFRHKWPEARIVERLDEVQSADFADDKSPLAHARSFIEEHRPPTDAVKSGDELRIIIKAMLMAEEGVTTVNQRKEKEIVNARKNAANPTYPAHPFKEAAE